MLALNMWLRLLSFVMKQDGSTCHLTTICVHDGSMQPLHVSIHAYVPATRAEGNHSLADLRSSQRNLLAQSGHAGSGDAGCAG